MKQLGHTAELARFTAGLRYENLPADVVRFTQDLFLDWIGSALAGRGARSVIALERFARIMGPDSGPSEILIVAQTHVTNFRGHDKRRVFSRGRARRFTQ